jgi:membrane protein YqaA with SNARE-associated domain
VRRSALVVAAAAMMIDGELIAVGSSSDGAALTKALSRVGRCARADAARSVLRADRSAAAQSIGRWAGRVKPALLLSTVADAASSLCWFAGVMTRNRPELRPATAGLA